MAPTSPGMRTDSCGVSVLTKMGSLMVCSRHGTLTDHLIRQQEGWLIQVLEYKWSSDKGLYLQ